MIPTQRKKGRVRPPHARVMLELETVQLAIASASARNDDYAFGNFAFSA